MSGPDAGCVDDIRNERLARIPPDFSRVRVDPPFLEFGAVNAALGGSVGPGLYRRS
jgi:hypothetical protein